MALCDLRARRAAGYRCMIQMAMPAGITEQQKRATTPAPRCVAGWTAVERATGSNQHSQLGRLCPLRHQEPRPAVTPGRRRPLLTVVYRG
jgi:hypothetical protein